MKRANQQTVLLGLLAMTVCSGCQTFGTATVRGQSPAINYHTGNSREMYHTPIRSGAAEIQDMVHEHHNTTTYYYNGNQGGLQQAGHHGGNAGQPCPPEGGGAYCPPGGYGDCPPGYHQGCRTGLCQDKFSYGYRVPNDLVYPPAGGVGGAVVYPYYTLKGPSDFFRQ